MHIWMVTFFETMNEFWRKSTFEDDDEIYGVLEVFLGGFYGKWLRNDRKLMYYGLGIKNRVKDQGNDKGRQAQWRGKRNWPENMFIGKKYIQFYKMVKL